MTLSRRRDEPGGPAPGATTTFQKGRMGEVCQRAHYAHMPHLSGVRRPRDPRAGGPTLLHWAEFKTPQAANRWALCMPSRFRFHNLAVAAVHSSFSYISLPSLPLSTFSPIPYFSQCWPYR